MRSRNPTQRNKTDMPMYPEIMVIPMREELTRLGIEELRTSEEVDQALKNCPGTTMVVVNSICGCAAGRMRPAVRIAMQNSTRPDHAYSVFAGQEKEATERALVMAARASRRWICRWCSEYARAVGADSPVPHCRTYRKGRTTAGPPTDGDRKSTRLNSSHLGISYAVF